MCECLFLALNRFYLVSLVGFFHALLLGLHGLWAGRRGLVFVLWAARLLAPSLGRAQGIKNAVGGPQVPQAILINRFVHLFGVVTN